MGLLCCRRKVRALLDGKSVERSPFYPVKIDKEMALHHFMQGQVESLFEGSPET